jgi:hypothetical protein
MVIMFLGPLMLLPPTTPDWKPSVEAGDMHLLVDAQQRWDSPAIRIATVGDY